MSGDRIVAIVSGGQSGRSEGGETRIRSFKEEAPVVNAVGMHDDAVLLKAELERPQVRQLFTSLHFIPSFRGHVQSDQISTREQSPQLLTPGHKSRIML